MLPEILALVDESLQHLAAPAGRLVESLLDFANWWTTPPAPSDHATAPLEDSSPAGVSVGVLEQAPPAGLAIETDAEADPSEDEEPEGDGSPRWRPWAWSPSPARAGDGAARDGAARGETGRRTPRSLGPRTTLGASRAPADPRACPDRRPARHPKLSLSGPSDE